jgi:hypothetical protein
MKQFAVPDIKNPNFKINFVSFIICRGDDFNLCDTCKIRFGCYSGEVAGEIFWGYGKKPRTWLVGAEYNLFGDIEQPVIDYDYDTHDKVYGTTCERQKLRYKH